MRVESLDDDELAGGAATTPAAEMEMLRSKVEAKSSSYMANQQANAQLDPNQLKADVDKLARRMKAMNRGLIDLNGKFIQYWDFFTISALLFTLFVTPVEVALVDKVEVDALFIINQVVALIFVAGGEKITSLGFMYLLLPLLVGNAFCCLMATAINNVSRARQYPLFY